MTQIFSIFGSQSFQSLCPPLTDDEAKRLEVSILAEGCREPICVWNDMIVDGHHRFRICQKHGVDFDIRQMEFADEDEAREWIITNQLARRNISEHQRALLLGKLYRQRKKTHGGDRRSSVQNEHLKTAEKIGADFGVSRSTVQRVDKYAQACERLADTVHDDILAGSVKASKKDVESLALLPTPTQLAAVNNVKCGEFPTLRDALGCATSPRGGADAKDDQATVQDRMREWNREVDEEKDVADQDSEIEQPVLGQDDLATCNSGPPSEEHFEA